MVDIHKLDQKRLLLEGERSGLESLWRILEQFVMPFRGEFFGGRTTESSINWRKRNIFDSTVVIANQNLAANLHSGITNPLFPWFQYTLRGDQPKEVREWEDETSAIIFQTLQESNFELSANECYNDLPCFGIGAQLEEVEEDDKGDLEDIVFSSLPPGDYVFETDLRGRTVSFWRRRHMTLVEMEEKFGIAGLPKKYQEMIIRGVVTAEKYEVIFCVFKRRNVDEASRFEILQPKLRPYGKIYYMVDSKEMLGEEDGCYEMPVYLPRWRTTSGSIWGNSPAMVVLSNVLSLNEMIEYILRAAEKAVDPPTIGTKRGVIGDVDLSAGGHTVVRRIDALKEFLTSARMDVSELGKNDLREMINQTFFVDQLQLKDSPAMTATEVNARFQLMQRLIGPTLHRFQEDWLTPLLRRTFGILYRYKKIPELPAVLLERGGDIDIKYVGAIDRAQKESEAQLIERFMGSVTATMASFPEVGDVPKAGDLMEDYGRLIGIKAKYMNDQAERRTLKEDRQRMMEEKNRLENANQGAAAAKTMAEAENVATQ